MVASPYSANEFKPKITDYVYCLRNPISDYDIFYVGRTTDLKTRLWQHISSSRENASGNFNKEKGKIIRQIISSGMKPIIATIDKTEIRCEYDKNLADYKEVKWIRYYLEIGWNLTNIKDINRDLSDLNFSRLEKQIQNGESINVSTFLYGRDKFGRKIYDIKKLETFGYTLPKHLLGPKNKKYTYDPIYNDIPPDW